MNKRKDGILTFEVSSSPDLLSNPKFLLKLQFFFVFLSQNVLAMSASDRVGIK